MCNCLYEHELYEFIIDFAKNMHFLPSPQAVENMAVWVDPQHYVLCGGVVDERSLRVHEKYIRHPDLLYQTAIKGHALVRGAGKGQTLVLPVVSKV